ncbi:MAG: hypothetical protein AAFR77_20675 [Cyanobacteria bacterium J06631_2]
METVNGKLLGNADDDSPRLEQEFHDVNREVSEIKQYLGLLEQRYQKLEVLVDIKHRQQIQAYQQELKSIHSPIRQIAGKLAVLERNKLSKIESNLNSLEQQIPKRIFWLGFYSSLIFGFISLWNWFELHPLDESMAHDRRGREEIVREYTP